jgi:hypothetical protein
MTTRQNWIGGLAVAASLVAGCGEAGPVRGSAEWYLDSAMASYAEGDFTAALENLEYTADGEDELATRTGVLTGILRAGLARANMEVADALRTGVEKNQDLVPLVRAELQLADRAARQNIISFVEGLSKFKAAVGTGDVTLAFPFPPGNREESSALNSLKKGEEISELQLSNGIRDLQQLGVVETVARAAKLGNDYTAAQAKFDAGPVTVPNDEFQLIVADFLVEMSGVFTQKKMNEPKVRDVVIQRGEEWIASGLESQNADIKARAEELKVAFENERRDVTGLPPL